MSYNTYGFLQSTFNLANVIAALRKAAKEINWFEAEEFLRVDTHLGIAEAIIRRNHMEHGVNSGAIKLEDVVG